MIDQIILMLYFIFWYFLAILSILFIVCGVDDLFFDVYYWIRYVVRLWKMRRYKPLHYEQLIEKEEQLIAILVPCWHEAGVIGTMLKHNCYSIDYKNYYIFVGVYPNDPATVQEVEEVALLIPNVRCVIGKTPGPTNKAANLNGIYEYVRELEKTLEHTFNIFVFHDSEDIIHPLSFKLYNYLIPRKDMIQIPIFPLAVNFWNFTHWLYADEFSENHTKDIIVRESIHGHVPSAGVGTAFSRYALQTLENLETKTPFATNSLTEDYRTSLAIRVQNMQPIFVSRYIIKMKWKLKGIFHKRYEQVPTREYIATRALFPLEYKKAVRQKARWIIGIVFQEWQHTKWPKEWAIRFTLAHDRKSFITHFINGGGYFVFFFWVFYSILTFPFPQFPALQEQFNLHPMIFWFIIIVTIIMLERMLQRMIALRRVYGWVPALLSIPRTFYGNILNLHALLRAYRVYFAAPKTQETSKQPAWDKTDHHFPGSHILTPYKHKLGDILLKNKLISEEQLQTAVLEQQRHGGRLGEVLCRLNFITPQKILHQLSEQYKLSIFPKSQLKPLPETNRLSSNKTLHWLIDHNVAIVFSDSEHKRIILGLTDPTNELLIEKIINRTASLKTEFVLMDPYS